MAPAARVAPGEGEAQEEAVAPAVPVAVEEAVPVEEVEAEAEEAEAEEAEAEAVEAAAAESGTRRS